MKGSAITGRGNMVQTRHWVERAIAIALLIVSVLGTVVVLHGGWAPFLRFEFTVAGVLGGLLLQGVLTWAQWAYGDNKRSFVYLVALVPTVLPLLRNCSHVVPPSPPSCASARGTP